MKKLRIGALLAAGLMALSFAGTAFAADNTVGWTGNGWPISTNCKDSAPGEMLWIYTGDSSQAKPVLTVNGVVVAQSATQGGSDNSSWHIVTAYLNSKPSTATTFVTFSGTGGGVLTISHGCPGETTTTTTTTAGTTTTTNGTTTTTTTAGTTTTTTAGTTSSTAQETTTSTSTVDGTSSSTTTTSTKTTTTTPAGGVEAATGTPTITPPATDSVGSSGRASAGSWNLLLAAGLVLTLSILVLTPITKSRRNK